MQIADYLQEALENCSRYELTDFDKNLLEKEGIEAYIFHKLASKKFRKYAMSESLINRVKRAVSLCVEKNEPINLVYPQGGYKLWRFPSSPQVDWAEFFAIGYVLNYIAPIAKAYQPGVKITFYMHTLLMELHDNLTSKEIAEYVDSFEKLLTSFSKYLSNNITLEILKDADLYSREEYFSALEEGKSHAQEEYDTYPQARKDELARMAKLNIKWNGKVDWTTLSDKEKEQKIYLAALYEMSAVTQLTKVKQTIKAEDRVLAFTKGSDEFIGIGSSKASIAKYWTGFGILTQKNGGYLPVILTPSQFESAQKMEHTEEAVNLINLPNLKTIRIYPELNFSNHRS